MATSHIYNLSDGQLATHPLDHHKKGKKQMRHFAGIKRRETIPIKKHFHSESRTIRIHSKLNSLIYKMLSTKLLVVFFFVTFQSSVLASLNLHGQPLFSGVTEFTFEVATSTLTKRTPCYITEGQVSQCRKKRGMEEKPQIQSEGLDIEPSAVMG